VSNGGKTLRHPFLYGVRCQRITRWDKFSHRLRNVLLIWLMSVWIQRVRNTRLMTVSFLLRYGGCAVDRQRPKFIGGRDHGRDIGPSFLTFHDDSLQMPVRQLGMLVNSFRRARPPAAKRSLRCLIWSFGHLPMRADAQIFDHPRRASVRIMSASPSRCRFFNYSGSILPP